MPLLALNELGEPETAVQGMWSLYRDVMKEAIRYMDLIPREFRYKGIRGQNSVYLLFWHIARLADAAQAVILQPRPDAGEPDIITLARQQLWYELLYHEAPYNYEPYGLGNGLGYLTGYLPEAIHAIPEMEWEDIKTYFILSTSKFGEKILMTDLKSSCVGFPPKFKPHPALGGILVVVQDGIKHFGQIEFTLSELEKRCKTRNQPHIVEFREFLRRTALDPS